MLNLSFEIIFRFLLPVIIFIGLFVGYLKFKSFFIKCSLDKPVLALLTLGVISTSVINIPIFINHDLILTINFGSIIIPLIISFYFIYKLQTNPIIIIMILMVSLITFSFAYADPDFGIIIDFPMYFIPILFGVLFAILIPKRAVYDIVPISYCICTIGVFVGTDVLLLPAMLEHRFSIGYLGGQGILDFIYIAGLFAIAFSIFYCFIRAKNTSLSKKQIRSNPKQQFQDAWRLYENEQYGKSIKKAINAIFFRLSELVDYKLTTKNSILAVRSSGLSKTKQKHYLDLLKIYRNHKPTKENAFRIIIIAESICNSLIEVRKRQFAPVTKRIYAFIIDAAVQAVMFIILFYLIFGNFHIDLFKLFIGVQWMTFLGWAWVIHITYFTIFEWHFGQTLGKMFVKIKVTTHGSGEPSKSILKPSSNLESKFIRIFSRNVFRLFDLVLGFYIISIFLVSQTANRQRIGDLLANTVIIKV